MSNLSICHRCPHRQRTCAGPCPCTVDGIDIRIHAQKGDCPKGYFDHPEAMPKPTPRDVPAPIQPIPREQWPLAARVLARLAKEGDKGLGDTVERLASMVGGEMYKRLAKRAGIDCGCAGRQATMNAKYPL